MFFPNFEKPTLRAEDKATLQNLTIDDYSPGSILHDFDVLLNLVKAGPLPITPSGQLPRATVSEINVRLTHPVKLGLQRPQQKSFPPVLGLYLLLRASGLTSLGGTAKQPLLLLEDSVYQQWTKMNSTERFGTLLEAWLLRGKMELLGDPPRFFEIIPDNWKDAIMFLMRIPEGGQSFTGRKTDLLELSYTPGWHNLGLMSLFGMITIDAFPPEPGEGWRLKSIHRTETGMALLRVLHGLFFDDLNRIFSLDDDEEIERLPFQSLQPGLQPYFPDWKNTLTFPESAFREGTSTFKVSLGRVWRRIAIDATESFDRLASIILDAFEFDSDHLYEFSYKNRYGLVERLIHPHMDEGPFTSEVTIGDVPLPIGQTMTFLFDFGDNWQFVMTLEGVDADKVNTKPRILEKQGKSPEQYPRW